MQPHATRRSTPTRLTSFALGALALCTVAACAPTSRASVSGEPVQRSRFISAEQIRDWGSRTAWDVLRRVGGLSISETPSGAPGSMNMRGRGSILLSDVPLVVVDGAQMGDIAVLRSIQAQTISSIEILNAAQATSRHGVRAGGGAIVVTTRRH